QIHRKPTALAFTFRRTLTDRRPTAQKRRLMIGAIGVSDTSHTNRHSFRSIAFKQCLSAPTIDHSGKLPSQVNPITHSAIHPKSAGRRPLMHSVTGEKDSPAAIGPGYQSTPLPRQHREHLIRKVGIHSFANTTRDIKRADIRVRVNPQFGQAPKLASVDGNKIAPMTTCVDESKKSCPSFVMQCRKLRRSKENADAKTQHSFARIFDPKRLAREPVEAVATDEIF